jgi:hypothetical protein
MCCIFRYAVIDKIAKCSGVDIGIKRGLGRSSKPKDGGSGEGAKKKAWGGHRINSEGVE